MSITLTTMRYFLEAARSESFSAAAARLYTAQPNLSKSIAGLERSLGVDLFYRDGRYMRLTEAGQLLYREWSGAIERIDRSILQARQLEQERTRTVTIGILEGMSITPNAPERFGAFRKGTPSVKLLLERGGITDIWQRFNAKKYDMIVTGELHGSPHAAPPSCLRRVVYSCRGVIAINSKNPMAERDALTLTLPMLRDETFVVLSQEDAPEGYRTVSEICRRAGVTPRETQRVASIETLMLYVEVGIGVAILGENNRLTSNPNVRLIPLEDILFDVVVYCHTDSVPRSVNDIIDAIQEGQG